MICRQIGDGPCKTHLLVSEKTREAVLVDPLLEKVDANLALLASEKLKLALVVDTHTHADHLSAGAVLRDRLGVGYAMHEATKSACVTRKLKDGETLGVGDVKVTFLHTPGHTRDSLTVALPDRVLTGDFLFIGSYGAGRLDLPGSDPAIHFESLKKLDGLGDDLLVMPGHDYQGLEQSTLGAERKVNPVLSPRTREKYVDWWAGRKMGPAEWMGEVVKANLAGARSACAVNIPKEGAACACASAGEPAEALPQIAARDLASNLRRDPRYAVLLDVRTHEEYVDELRHIAGTVLIPVDELPSRLREVPEGEVVVICRSGKRAARAASLLRANGRGKVWVLTGGMLAWNEARLPVA